MSFGCQAMHYVLSLSRLCNQKGVIRLRWLVAAVHFAKMFNHCAECPTPVKMLWTVTEIGEHFYKNELLQVTLVYSDPLGAYVYALSYAWYFNFWAEDLTSTPFLRFIHFKYNLCGQWTNHKNMFLDIFGFAPEVSWIKLFHCHLFLWDHRIHPVCMDHRLTFRCNHAFLPWFFQNLTRGTLTCATGQAHQYRCHKPYL